MKQTYTIIVETNNMNKVYENDIQQKEITEQIENELHNAIKQQIKTSLCEENLNEMILNDIIPDFEFTGMVDGWDNLSDYGNIKITFVDEDTIEEEKVCDIKNINKEENSNGG